MTGAGRPVDARSSPSTARSTPPSPCPGSKSLTNRALVCAGAGPRHQHADRRAVRRRHRGHDRLPARAWASTSTVDDDGRPRRVAGTGRAAAAPDRSTSTPACRAPPPGSCCRSLGIGPGPYRLDGAPPLRARPMGAGHRRAAPRWASTWTSEAIRATSRCVVARPAWPPASVAGRRRSCPASSCPVCCWPRRATATGLHGRAGRRGGVAALPRDDRVGHGRLRGRGRRWADSATLTRWRRGGYRAAATTPSSPTPRRRRTSSPPPPCAGGRVRVDGLGSALAAGRPGASCDVLERMGADGPTRPRRFTEVPGHRPAARHRRRPGRPARHGPDAGRGGRVRRRPDPGHAASASSAARRPIASPRW